MISSAMPGNTHDTSERTGDDSDTSQVPGFQGSVLTGRALAVVPVTDDNPLDAVLLVVTGNSRDSVVLASEVVLDLVGLAAVSADGTDKHVVGDVVKMSAVLQPGTGHGNVVGSGFSNGLDKNWHFGDVFAVPGLERLEELQAVRRRGDGDIDGGAVLGRSLVRILARVIATSGETVAGGFLELELLAILILQRIGLSIVSDCASSFVYMVQLDMTQDTQNLAQTLQADT